MAIDLAKLVVTLEAESAKLHKELDASNKKLSRFEKGAASAQKALGNFAKASLVGITATSLALTAMTKKMLDTADNIGKLSQSTGLSTETLSRLRFQAELTGKDFDTLTKGVGKFQRSMFDANSGLKVQEDAFKSLNVNVKNSDGTLRDTEAVMGDVAEAFSLMEDGAQKAALAQVLFGRAGIGLIPFLNEGKEGLAAMAKEADELGITMDKSLTQAAEKTNDNLTRMKFAIEGAFIRAIGPAIPKLLEITKAIVAWTKDTDKLSNSLAFLARVFKTIAAGAIFIGGVLESVGIGIAGLAAAAVSAAKGDFSIAGDILKQSWEDSDKALFDSLERASNLLSDVSSQVAGSAKETGAKLASPMTEAETQAAAAVDGIKKQVGSLDQLFKDAAADANKISKEFDDRLSKIKEPPKLNTEKANTLDVGFLEVQAQRAINEGDIDGATDKLRSAFDVLDAMKASGTESSAVLEGLGSSLKRVADQIGDQGVADVVSKIEVDLNSAVIAAMNGNEAMQKALAANPLIQTILFDEQSAVNAAVAGASGRTIDGVAEATRNIDTNVAAASANSSANQQNFQPVVVNLPGGGSHTLYSDTSTADNFAREIQLEANKRGKR